MNPWHGGFRDSSAIVSLQLRGYFVRHIFFSWVFHESTYFSRGYFVRSTFVLVANFVIQRFSVFGCVRKSDRKQKYISTSQIAYSISNRFQQLLVVFVLRSCFIYEISYVITQLSFSIMISLLVTV